MKLIVGGADFSQRYESLSVSGRRSLCATTLTTALIVSELDTSIPVPTIPRHSPVHLYDDEGTTIFEGMVVTLSRTSGTSTIQVTALDYGYILANNQVSVDVCDTPEQAVRHLMQTLGIAVGSLATTGVEVSRNFVATAPHQVIDTLYNLASQRTGMRYQIRFAGGTLCVVEKPTASDIVLEGGYNLRASSHRIDVSNYCNTVEIRSETGALIQTLGGSESLVGKMMKTITQRDGQDATGQAQQLLEDGEGNQSISATCDGDSRLMVGAAVIVRQSEAGVEGLFWIDGAVHSWKNGDYSTALTLNFRNLMNETNAGQEVQT